MVFSSHIPLAGIPKSVSIYLSLVSSGVYIMSFASGLPALLPPVNTNNDNVYPSLNLPPLLHQPQAPLAPAAPPSNKIKRGPRACRGPLYLSHDISLSQ